MTISRRALLSLGLVFILGGLPAIAAPGSATRPATRDVRWMGRHDGFVKQAKEGNVDLLFDGDSITDGWRGGGKAVWEKNFAPLKAINFGIGGDRTEHVLWRMRNGELDGIKPKLMVLMIGTNNLGANTNEDIVAGIKAILDEYRTREPQSKVLLLGIFPRSPKPTDAARPRIKAINEEIAKFEDKKVVFYMDIGAKFLDADGNLTKEIMPDALHPNGKGYEIWADAILATVKQLMGV